MIYLFHNFIFLSLLKMLLGMPIENSSESTIKIVNRIRQTIMVAFVLQWSLMFVMPITPSVHEYESHFSILVCLRIGVSVHFYHKW